jgi:gliding motility-associated-like protein
MNRRIWLIIVCIFSILPSFGQSLPSYVPTNGLMGWWPLDGNANDISGNGYNGTAYGVTATDDRHGNNNSAFSFDITSTGWGSAKDRIVITDDAIANAWYQANAFTISTWIKLDTKTGSFANRPHTILGVWDGNGTPITRHQISASNYQSTRLNSTVGGTTPVANNDWVHVVTTWDGDTLRHYQNGIPAGHSYLSYSIPSSTNYGDITFGELHMGNGHWYHFVGSMDDMGVWDRALSNNEISQLYNAPVPCSNITIGHNPPDVCSNNDTTLLYVTLGTGNNHIANPLLGSLSADLIAFYPFNGNADDTSGNGYNGTPSNLSNAADRLGNPNSAFEFNGTNSRIEVGTLPAIDCSSDGAFTVSGWFKSNQQNEGRILSFYPTTPDGTFAFQWSFNPSTSVLHVNVAKSQSANAPWAVITTTISNPSQWNHAVMTYEDGSLKLFINGSLAGSSQYTGPYAAKGANTVFNVDYISYDPNERFDGFIDDIGIWNNALSIDKIKALYTGQSILWSTGQNTDSIYVSPNSYQETYTVDVYSGNSVCSDSITVRAQNPFNFSDTTICLGDTLSLTADLDYQSGCLMNISHTGIPPGDPIPGFTYGGFYQGHYYYVHNTPTTWTQGERLCRQNGGYLVCINDINENTFVSNLVPSFSNKNIWIGLYRDSTTCEFRWLNCINIAYTNWRPGEPNNDPCNEPYTQIIRGCSSGLNSWNNLDDNAANGSCYSNMVPILEIDPTIGSTASISVLWSTGDTTNTIDVSPTTTTSYWVRKTIDSDTIIDTITVHVLDPTINTTSSSYCTSNDSATLWVDINEISSYNTCSGLPSTLENGLVAWYPMNGNANDESGNGLNGTTFNTNTVNGRSASSTSLEFNGSNSYVEASTNPLLENITSALTLSAWIKPNNTGSEGAIIARRDFVGNPNGERTHFQLSITSTGAIQFAAQNNSISNSNILVTSASQTVDYQDWNHVASTFEQDTVKIYHNGQLIHSQHTPNQVLSPNNHWMNIGRIHRSGGNTFFNEFSGSIDEIGIWNRAITLTEVNYLYSGYSLLWSTNQTDDSLYIPLDSTFQYYVVASQNGTTCSDSITISVNQGIQASDTTICYGDSVTLSTINGQSAIWSTGDTATTITVNPATTTKYWATTSYIGGTCSDTLKIDVSEPIKVFGNSLLCKEDSVLLYVDGSSFFKPSDTLYFNDFENLIGSEFSATTTMSFSGSSVLGNFGDQTITLSLSSLPIDSIRLSFDLWIHDSWDGNNSLDGPDSLSISWNQNSLLHTTFSNQTGGIQSYPNNYPVNNPSKTGSILSASSLCSWPESSKYRLSFDINNTSSIAVISFDGTPGQGLCDESWSIDNVLIEGLNAVGKNSIIWSTGQISDSIWVKPTQTTTYWVNQTLNGKSCFDSVSIGVNQGIQASDTTICYGGSVTLSTISGQLAIWSTGDTASSITVNPATTTKYWATTSYVGGTCSDTLTVFVNAPSIHGQTHSCNSNDSLLLWTTNTSTSTPNSVLPQCNSITGSLKNGLVAYYPFCGNANDISNNGNHGVVNGASLASDRFGKPNSAYIFDGSNDFIEIANSTSLSQSNTNGLTLSCWIKHDQVWQNPKWLYLISKTDGTIQNGDGGYILRAGADAGAPFGYVPVFKTVNGGNQFSSTNPITDVWEHLCLTYNNDTARFYRDGILVKEYFSGSSPLKPNTRNLILGASVSNSSYFKGILDEVGIWDRALSQDEVAQLMNTGTGAVTTLWSTGQTNDSIWVKPTQTTTYWIEQSLNGVTCTDSATVFINKVNIEPSLPTICTPGDSVLLYAPGVEQGFDEPNCNSGYVGLRPTYTPGESISGYSYKGMYNGHHYYLANSPGSWTDAAAAAKIAGGHLVCIDDVNEQNFVANLSTGNLWLGYYRTPTNAWAWVNCQTSTYTNWRSGEPGTSEPYAHIITDNCSYNGGANQWNDIGNLSNNGVCYSNCYGVLEIDPDETGFGQNSQVLSWSNGASNDSIWLTPNQDGDYWLTSYVNGEGCSDTVSLRVLNPAITAPTTTSCSPGDSVMLYYSGNREFAGLDTIAVLDQLIGQETKSMTVQWTQSWNVSPNQTYIMKVSGLYDICCGSQGCLDPAFLTLNCYSQSQQSASNPCSNGAWWKFNDNCGIRPDVDVYNPSHEYYYTFENNDGTVDLSFFDSASDNNGSLTFTLYSTKQKVVRTYNDTITWSTGETSDTIWVNPTSTSTYSVTASRGGVNCLDSVQIDVTTLSNFDPLIPTRIHCEATNTVLDGTDASATSYNWSTGAQTSSTTVNTSGQYWVQATDNLGCSFSDTTQVWISNIQSNLSSIEPTCYGLSNGSITPNPTGGISSYSYLWSNGDTTAALSATASGLYWVTVTDSVGCSVQDSILLDEPADLTVTASATSNYNGYNIPCFGGSNGQANAVVSGGTLPYTYSWSNGSPDSIVYSLAAGTHTVNIMDSNGCITSDTVLITQPTGINTSLTSTSSYNGFDISCYGAQDGSIQLAVSGGVTPYQHYWSTGANGTSVSNIGAGLYTVNTVDANGCSSVDSITLNQPTVLTSTATVVSNYNGYNVSCYGATDGSAQISAIGGNAPYTYSWSNGTTSNQNNGIGAGSYSVTVTDTNGCTVQNSVVLNEPTELQISTSVTSNFNGYPITCTGANDGSALVNSNGGTAPYTILWSNGDTSLTTNNLSAGTYFVTVTDANGCSKSDSVVLTDPIGLSNLTLSASSYNGFNISCHGENDGTISMTGVNGGTAPLSYYWNTGDSTSSITGLPVGNYTLTVTDINGCSISDSLTLNQPTVLTSNASVTSNFNGTNISCNGAMDGSAQVSGAGGVGPYSFLWNTSDTSTTISNLSVGTYAVVVTDANGCSTTDTVSLTEPSLFSITAGVQSNYNGYNISCAGGANGQVAALAIGGTGPYNYSWSNGSSSPGQNNLAAGMYIINVSDANGCSAADTLTLIEPSALSSMASVTSNYNGYNVSCQGAQDGSATVNAQGGVTPYSINWSNGSSGATVSNLDAGVHTVTIQDANGCSTNASVNLTEPGGVSVTATSSPTTCFGADDGSATLTVSGGTGNFDIQWSNGGTGLNQTGLTSNWYTYTISTSPNCFLTDSIWVDQPEPLVIQVDTVPPTCISAFDGEINVVAFGGTPGYQYFLNGNAFSGFQDELGTDSLEIVAVDMNNCDTTLILAMPAQTQSCLFIPNWFTPNGNNQEDAWRIEGFEYENLRLKVFNVMGQLIYTAESSTYIPWDGNYNGSPLPEGDYYYLIESTVNDSKYSGYVTILR